MGDIRQRELIRTGRGIINDSNAEDEFAVLSGYPFSCQYHTDLRFDILRRLRTMPTKPIAERLTRPTTVDGSGTAPWLAARGIAGNIPDIRRTIIDRIPVSIRKGARRISDGYRAIRATAIQHIPLDCVFLRAGGIGTRQGDEGVRVVGVVVHRQNAVGARGGFSEDKGRLAALKPVDVIVMPCVAV